MDPPCHRPQKLNFFCSSPIFTKTKFTYPLFFLFILVTSIIFYLTFTSLQLHSLSDISFLFQNIPKYQNYSNTDGKNLKFCDYSNGKWVWDESYPLRFYNENCSFLDPGFRCRRNGRSDLDYLKWRWQPEGCDLPKFNATDFLERSRNGRIVFAGDSIGRNQWESLICMLAQGVSNISAIYEENGKPLSKHKGCLSIRFQEYNFTVEYYRVPFLVAIGRLAENAPKEVQGVIRVDQLHRFSSRWVGADVLVFNTGHWWNQDKTVKMGFYFQEEDSLNMTINVMEAFQKSLVTWKLWVMQNLDPNKSRIFFRSYSPVHLRNGAWNEGGHCDTYTSPETNYTKLKSEPSNNLFISEVVKQVESAKRKVYFLNITYLTEFRNDGHPSSHREPGMRVDVPQDCSHWCLPGVPDTWNELLYARLLSND